MKIHRFFQTLCCLSALVMCSAMALHGQNRVGIGTNSPDASAQLDVSSSDGGLLIPRLDTSAIASPATGLLIFQPSNNTFYYYSGSAWTKLGSGVVDADGDTRITAEDGAANDSVVITLDGMNKVFIKRNAGGEPMFDLQTSTLSTFFGRQAGLNATGLSNSGFGDGALGTTTSGTENIAFGTDALGTNSAGSDNTALGISALKLNTTGSMNTAVGALALTWNMGNSRSTAVGYNAMNLADNRLIGRSTYNTALGYSALSGSAIQSANTGQWNTAVGDSTLAGNSSGQKNTAVGSMALAINSTGSDNVAIGQGALHSNTGGSLNTAVGQDALRVMTNASANTALGNTALFNTTTGAANTGVGGGVMASNTTGSANVAIGWRALYFNLTNIGSTAIGYKAMYHADNGMAGDTTFNTAVGYEALQGSTSPGNNTGAFNTAIGVETLAANASGDNNTAVGSEALIGNKGGQNNVAVGRGALLSNISGEANTVVGRGAMAVDTGGTSNTVLGAYAGQLALGSGNVFLGASAGWNSVGSNKLFIENSIADSTGALIYGEFDNDYLRTNGRYEVLSTATGGADVAGIRSIKTYPPFTSYSDVPAIYGKNAVDDYYGIGVWGVGGWQGVHGEVDGTASGQYQGLVGIASGSGSGLFYGIKALASGAGTNYGVYGSASGGISNYGGYFDGDAVVTKSLGVGVSALANNTTILVKAAASDVNYFNVQKSTGTPVFAITPDYTDVYGDLQITSIPDDEMIISNSDSWEDNAGLQDFGDGGDYFIMAGKETSADASGIYGDGDVVTIWSPGDGAPGEPQAYIYILDEDDFDGDGDPYNNSALKLYLDASGVWQTSDRRKKENIHELHDALKSIGALKGYAYTFKQTDEDRAKGANPEVLGIMAQDLATAIPQAVEQNADGDYFVNYAQITPVLVNAINEQQALIKAQNTRIEEQEARLTKLEELVARYVEK